MLIVKKIDSASPLTTNSSSMLYIVNPNVAMEIDKFIQSSPYARWFGELHAVATVADLQNLIYEQYFIIHSLFYVPKYVSPYSQWANKLQEVIKRMNDFNLPVEERKQALLEYENLSEALDIITHECMEKYVKDVTIQLEMEIPFYFYSTREDNELDDDGMEFVYSLPLFGTRQS